MKKQSFQDPLIETNSVEVLSRRLIATTNELTIANQELSRAQRERDNLLSNISHDLRAPITAIRSAVDLLLSGQALSEVDKQLAIRLIDRRTTTLQTMIQDLYLLLILENNELPLNFETIAAGPFFEEYFYNTLLDERYDDKNMHLDSSEDMNLSITIDIQQMLRVLDNLFTNAAKYSLPDADITLSIKANTDSTHLIIQVMDTGIGIPADCLPNIFDRTYKVSNARTPESASGSGLGLCIVKTIVEKHHGQISCESQVNIGSTFTILLPVQ
jgi:signal transduction histidine kinase